MVNTETVREETRMAVKELGSGKKNTGTYNKQNITKRCK